MIKVLHFMLKIIIAIVQMKKETMQLQLLVGMIIIQEKILEMEQDLHQMVHI